MPVILMSIGIFGLAFGIFNFHHGPWGFGISEANSYYYYYNVEDRIIIGSSAILLIFGYVLLRK